MHQIVLKLSNFLNMLIGSGKTHIIVHILELKSLPISLKFLVFIRLFAAVENLAISCATNAMINDSFKIEQRRCCVHVLEWGVSRLK